MLAYLSSLFRGRSSAPQTPPDDLPGYLDFLADAVARKGFVILHPRDLDAPGHTDPVIGKAVARYKKSVFFNRDILKTQEQIRKGRNAVINKDHRYILMPEREGLLETFCKDSFPAYSAAKMRAAGITDMDIYAHTLIHEASHALGNNTDGKGRFFYNETHVAALTTARYLNHGGNPALLDFMNNRDMVMKNFDLVFSPTSISDGYDWTANAEQWTTSRAFDSAVWDKDNDGFHPQALSIFNTTGKPGPRANGRVVPGQVRTALTPYIDIWSYNNRHDGKDSRTVANFHLPLRDAAYAASRDLMAKGVIGASGPDDNLRAALILRQLARAIDGVLKYVDYDTPQKAAATPAPANP